MTNPRWTEKQAGWRKSMGDMQRLLGVLADKFSELPKGGPLPLSDSFSVRGDDGAMHSAEDIIRRAAHLLKSQEANVAAEERHAWDLFATAALGRQPVADDEEAAQQADRLLGQRRKRFSR